MRFSRCLYDWGDSENWSIPCRLSRSWAQAFLWFSTFFTPSKPWEALLLKVVTMLLKFSNKYPQWKFHICTLQSFSAAIRNGHKITKQSLTTTFYLSSPPHLSLKHWLKNTKNTVKRTPYRLHHHQRNRRELVNMRSNGEGGMNWATLDQEDAKLCADIQFLTSARNQEVRDTPLRIWLRLLISRWLSRHRFRSPEELSKARELSKATPLWVTAITIPRRIYCGLTCAALVCSTTGWPSISAGDPFPDLPWIPKLADNGFCGCGPSDYLWMWLKVSCGHMWKCSGG